MDSLNHLKTTYRPRFFNREGQKQAIDIQGKNVLECIQDRFGICAKKFTECSPNISCGSSPNLDQIPCQSKKISLKPSQMSGTKNVATNLSFLVSPGRIKRNSGNNISEEEILDGGGDVLTLGSPALLEQEDDDSNGGEKLFGEQLHFNEEVFGLHNSRNFSKPESFSAAKETNDLCTEESKHLVISSNRMKISKSLSSLEAMKSASILRNEAHIEPQEECEFLIEESFGVPSESWISMSRKKQKPQEKRLITASFEGNKAAKQHHERRKGKREKVVMPTPAKEIKTTLNRAAERMQNASVGKDPSQLAISITQEAREQIHSKDKDSVKITNRSHQVLTSTEEAQEHVSLLEKDHRFSVQTQPVKSAEQCSFQNQLTMQTELHDENQPECPMSVMSLKGNSQSKPIKRRSGDLLSVLSPVSIGQQSPQSKPDRQKLQSKKQLTQKKKKKKSSRLTRRKNGWSVSEKTGESVHGEEQLGKEKEKHPYKLRRTGLSRALPQQVKRAALLNSKNSIYQEDSCEQHVAVKSLSSSVKQQNRHGPLLQSCALDANMNISGPVGNDNMSSRKEKSIRDASSSSDESADHLNAFASNSLKYKLVLPTNTPNVRRTKRMRIKPLEYWRGQRVEYKRVSSGDFVIGGIFSPEQKKPKKPKPEIIGIPLLELENMHRDSVILKDPSEPAVVFDKESNQILLECVNNGSSKVYSINNEILSIDKYLSTPSFSAGKMILKPLKEKGYQYSHTDTLVFHIVCGNLLLMLYDQNYFLTAGSYFFIPPGNVYNLRNLSTRECVILFTQLKGKG